LKDEPDYTFLLSSFVESRSSFEMQLLIVCNSISVLSETKCSSGGGATRQHLTESARAASIRARGNAQGASARTRAIGNP